MYSTYQRALSAAGLTVPAAMASKRRFIRAIRARLNPAARRDPNLRDKRKAFYRACLEHLENDYGIMASFRL